MRLLLVFLLISIVTILPINREALAGGGMYWDCNTADFGRNCFAYKSMNLFFNDSFIPKKEVREKFTREKISVVWSLLSRANKYSGAIDNTDSQAWLKSATREKEKIKRIKKRYYLYLKKNKYLKKISGSIKFRLNGNWCLERFDQVLNFSEAVMKENPGNENAKRIGAARFLVNGERRNWCSMPINRASPKFHTVPSDVQRLLSKLLLEVKERSVENAKKLRPWILYMQGAKYFNSGDLKMAYNSFQKVIATSKKRKSFQKWPFETSYYMKLRIKFHLIRRAGHVRKYDAEGKFIKDQNLSNVIREWRKGLVNFRNQFPSSHYLPHAEQMSIGLYYHAGDEKKYLELHLNEVTRLLGQVEKDEFDGGPHVWAFINRVSFLLDNESALLLSFIRRNHHPKIKIMYALANGIDAKSEQYLCSESIDPTRDFSNRMLFDICQNYKYGSYPNLSDYQHTGLEIEMTYLAFLTALEKNDFKGAKSFLKIIKGNLEERNRNYLTIAIGRWFMKSLDSGRVTYYFENGLSQIVKKESSPLIRLIRAYQLEVFSRDFANPKDFMLLLESAESELDRFALLFPHFSQALLYNDRETAIVLAEKVSFEKLLRNKILGHSNYYLEAIKAVKDVYHELRHNSKSSKSDFLIGSFLHLQGIFPSCSEKPPSPLAAENGRQSCGYMRFAPSSGEAVFVTKKLIEPGLNPIDLFRRVVSKTLFSSYPLEKLEIATLNRLIYCLKGKRIESCVRGATVKKSEVKSWFRRINFKEKRQKYWFFPYGDVVSNIFSAPYYCFRCRKPYEGLQSDYYVIKRDWRK
ncbi:MAG: hypothetical protein VX794_04730 [Nitrospinota bacterium]|nr:hypothetical protein [Nitrospinota bacterium]